MLLIYSAIPVFVLFDMVRSQKPISIMLIPIVFLGLLVFPIVYLLIQYFKEDYGKHIAIRDDALIFETSEKRVEFDLKTDVLKVIIVVARGFKNPVVGFGFLEIHMKNSELIYITSLSINPDKNKILSICKARQLEIGFPRIGINTEGRGEQLADSLMDKVEELRVSNKEEVYKIQVSYFEEKFSNKSIDELRKIVKEDRFEDYAIEASKNLIKRMGGDT